MKYRWNAKRRHGIHSPFIYELTDKCFQTDISSGDQVVLSQTDKKLKHESRSIEITDHGAGSRRLGQRRKISAIYRTSSSSGKYGKMLYQIANYYKIKSSLELGTSLGVGTLHLSLGNPKGNVTSIEGCPNTFNEAQINLKESGLKNFQLISGTFNEALPGLKERYDLIFIDGHHDGDALLAYLDTLIPNAHENTFFILDDIRWSASMKRAWTRIMQDERFHVTIDLFRMGIVLLRPQQEKEHFQIRL